MVWYVVRNCCKKAGLDHIAPHDLRRTCAKLCHAGGGELEQIQFLLALGRKIPPQQRRTCSYHSPEKFLTLSLGLGSLVKEAISTELLSLDRSKIEGMFKEIQAIRSKTFVQGLGDERLPS